MNDSILLSARQQTHAIIHFNPVIAFTAILLILLLFIGLCVTILLINSRNHTLKRLSDTDSLTGLFNRHGITCAIEKYIAGHPQDSCVAITLDIDDFKFINDMYGHVTGDYALQQLAFNMKEVFSNHGLLARYGGDEFSVFLTDCAPDTAAELIERFIHMPRTFCCEGRQLSFNISLGYALYPTHATTSIELFRKADIALYEVKLRGKNDFLAYDPCFVPAKRSQLGFALKDVSKHLPAAFLICKANPIDDRILFANEELLRLTGCKDLDALMHFTNDRFSCLIDPSARDQIQKSIYSQARIGQYDTDTHVEFPLRRTDEHTVSVFCRGRIVENNFYGKIFYVLITDADTLRSNYSI